MAALTANLTQSQLAASPSPDQWSVNDVLAHLRACADVWGDCIATILRQETTTLRAVNPRQWIKRTTYPKETFGPSLDAFVAQRFGLLARLEGLDEAQWKLSVTVTGAGNPLQRTVFSYAERLARHEHVHIGQVAHIARVLRG